MATGEFPSNSSMRKAILVLRQHDVEKCAYETDVADTLLDEEAYVLPFPVPVQDGAHPALQNIIDAGLARPGMLLVQSPYDPDAYEDAALAAQRFALAKHMYFSTLCRFLGAKDVSVEQIDLKTSVGKSSLVVEGERQGARAQVSMEREELEKLRSQIQLRDEFAGGNPDVVAAERLLRRTGLWADPTMRALLEMRQGTVNPLTTRRLVLSLSSEAQKNVNVAGRLRVPAFVKLSAQYDKVLREQCEYTLTVVVRFS